MTTMMIDKLLTNPSCKFNLQEGLKTLKIVTKMKKNEEIQTRREFFKSAAKGALPILAFTMLGSTLLIGCSKDGCDDCVDSCSDSCVTGCKSGCSASCSGACKGSCKTLCTGACKGTCSRRYSK